jgi:hypothetical protein
MSSSILHRRKHTAGVAALLAAAGLMLGACGTTATADPGATAPAATDDGDRAATDDGDRAATDDGDRAATDDGDRAATDTVEVIAVDYAYKGLPETITAGTRLLVHNDAPAELHELIAMRLSDGENRPVPELLELPEDQLDGVFAGEPATVILAPPGEDGFPVVGDGVLEEPGRYVVICAIPTGADPEEYLNAPEGEGPPQVDGGPPHFEHGMWAEVVVTTG